MGGAKSKKRLPVSDQVEVENVNVPGQVTRVQARKYEAMRRALLRVLPRRSPGLTQKQMFEAAAPELPGDLFPGGATSGWWVKCVQLDLESKGLVRRETDAKPLRWHRA